MSSNNNNHENLKDWIDDILEVAEINTENIIIFKELSHKIDEAFGIIEIKLEEIGKRIKKLEDKEWEKGFHNLSRDIEKIIREHSQRLPLVPPSEYPLEFRSTLLPKDESPTQH